MSESPTAGPVARAGLAVFLVATLVACGSESSTPASVAPTPASAVARTTSTTSVESVPLVLRLGTNDPADGAGAPVVERFAAHLEEISRGAVTVEPLWHAAGDPPPDAFDQAVAQLVITGELDLAVVTGAAWDTEGVSTLRALYAPFLVDSDELTAAIVNGETAIDLMAGFESVGVEGLALIPEGMRHVFSFSDALVTVDDFDGAAVRSPQSDTVWALLEALGAEPQLMNGSVFDEAVASGTVVAAESSFARAAALPGESITATGNLTLFPRVTTLVANGEFFAGLSHAQRQTLRDAAEATLSDVLAEAVPDAELAAAFCAETGSVDVVSDEELAAFEAAAAPVYEELEADPATRAMIQRIRELAADVPAGAAVEACEHDGAGGEPNTQPAETIRDGTYVKTVNRDVEIARGLDPAVVNEFMGADGELVLTLTFEHGRWTQRNVLEDGSLEVGDVGTFSYDEEGRLVTVSTSGGCRGCTGVFDWSLADGVLTITAAEGQGLDDAERLHSEGDWVAE
ncbi:hypothetical protein BH18ACT3_BH18ACT3_15150 [soil metagenome]